MILAAAMTLSVLSPFAAPAFAEEAEVQTAGVQVESVQATDENAVAAPAPAEEEPAAEEESQAVQQAAALFAALPGADAVAGMSDEEKAAVSDQVAEAINAVDALSLEDYDAFMAQYGDLYDTVTTDLFAALMAEPEDTPTDLSLQPMEETTGVYLPLYNYSKEELQNFPVDNIPGLLVDWEGTPVEVADGYTSAWIYYPEDDRDEMYTLGSGQTVDLWDYSAWESVNGIVSNYSIWLVLGHGNQVDETAHRYIIRTELNTPEILDLNVSFELRTAQDGYLQNCYGGVADKDTDIVTSYPEDSLFSMLGMEGRIYNFYVYGQPEGSQYVLRGSGFSETEKMERMGYHVAVYRMGDFIRYRDEGGEFPQEITEQLFPNQIGVNYSSSFDTILTADNYKDADNLFCIACTDKATGEIRGYVGVGIQVFNVASSLKCQIWSYEDGQMKDLGSMDWNGSSASMSCELNPASTGNDDHVVIVNQIRGMTFTLPEGYSLDGEYYMTFPDNGGIQKVYSDGYMPQGEADPQYDVTDQILVNTAEISGTEPYGYKLESPETSENWNMVMCDGTSIWLRTYMREQYVEPEDPDIDTPTEPSEPDIDPSFELEDVLLDGTSLENYIATSVQGIQLDTYYRTDEKYDVGGYRLVFIKQQMSEEEFKQLVPVFDVPFGVEVSSGGRVESGVSDLQNVVWADNAQKTVLYQAQVPGKKVKNYQVTFATLQSQGTLLVAGPDERFLNLTADNDYIHDILVANIGATNLEGVKVELINPVHVKLDPYWTLNGETIPAFTQVEAQHTVVDEAGQVTDSEHNWYASPDNITKIRLLADGEGEISGTLRVTTADGQQRDIKLTGIAANPHIVSGDLADAVMYVPYSYMVVTDNMYNWNRLTFKITDGALPAGMQLYEATGEIYGTPQETGDFQFTVEVDYSSSRFSPSTATFTLHVADNTNQMVYEQTDPGYEIQVPLGVEQGEGTYDFLITDITQDQLYVSEGIYPEFVDLWLNGEKLVRGVDYMAVSGSTRITIKSQTLQDKALKNDYNTIAAEFRVNGDRDNELKRTAQNFRLGEIQTVTSDDNQNGGSSSGGSAGSGSGTTGTTGNTSGSTSGGNGQNGGSASGTAAQDAAAQAAAAQAAAQAAKGVTLRFYVVDEQDAPLSGVSVELHSNPRYGTTDANGCVVFRGVEFGPHTLTVYGKDGSVLGSKSFELVSGSFGTNGDTITVMGGSTLTIRVKAAGGSLSFTKIDLPQTGDESDMVLWIGVLALAVCAFAGVTVYRRKRSGHTSSQS